LAPTAVSFHAMDVCISGINHGIIIKYIHTIV